MRWIILLTIALTACGGSPAPQPTIIGYQSFNPQDAPHIDIISPLDSTTTPQQPKNLTDVLHLAPGTWPFSWTPIDNADNYTLYVYDMTGVADGLRSDFDLYAEVPVSEPAAVVDLTGEPLDGLTPRVYFFEVAAFEGLELAGQSDTWAIAIVN